MKQLKNRVAVVTGAGSGIGKATALELARRGCRIASVDINGQSAEETATEARDFGVSASSHTVDVADRAQMAALPEAVIHEHGGVNIVVNNAGTGVFARLEDHSMDDFEWIVGINLWGVIYGSKFFLDALKDASAGHIVNISSAAGIIPMMSMSSYCTTKFAVRGFSESIRPELAEHNIGVTVVHPGLIATNIGHASKMVDPEAARTQDRTANLMERFGRSPQRAARMIVDGIRHNRQRVLIGWEAHMWDLTKRMFPVGNDSALAAVSRRIGPF